MAKGISSDAIKNSMWEFLSKVIEKGGAVIFTIILARFLLPEGFGTYSLALAVALIFISAIDSSVDITSIRYVSNALKRKNKQVAAAYFKYILRLKLILASIASASLLILSYPLAIYIFHKPYLFAPLFISGFYIFVFSISNHYESLFYTIKRVQGKLIKNTLQQISKIFFSLLVFFIAARIYYVVGIIAGLAVTSMITLIFIFFYINKFAPFLFEKSGKYFVEKKRIMRFFNYLFVTSIITLLFMYIDVLMLGFFISDIKYIGFYSGSISLIGGITGLLSFAVVFLPVLTQIKKDRINEVFNKVIKYSFMISIPAAFGIAVVSNYIIFLVYGYSYLEASIILSVLAFLVIESVNGSLISMLITAKEKPEYVTKIYFISLILSIILNFSLINLLLRVSPLYAAVGAAVATIISRYFAFFMIIKIAGKKLKIHLNTSSWGKPLISAILMAGIIELVNIFIIKDMTLVFGIGEVLFGITFYLIFMLLIKGIRWDDFAIIKDSLLAR